MPERNPGWSAWQGQAQIIFAILIMAAPAFTPAASMMRLVFPALAAVVGAYWFYRQDPAKYVGFCFWLFIVTPFVRRIVDYKVGFTEGSLLMLAPYAAAAIAFVSLPQFFTRRQIRGQVAFAAVFLAVFYGFLLALLNGRVNAGAFDMLRWAVPPAIAAYILVNDEHARAIGDEIRRCCLIALPVLSLYGLYQYVAPPQWDAIWMIGSKMNSIGVPLPYQIRIFSTLNSPGSFAYYLLAFLLFGLSGRGMLRFLSLGLGAAALAVTLVRSAWLALAAGLLLLLIIGTWRVRVAILTVAGIAIFALPIAYTVPQVGQNLSARLQSVTELSRDYSAADRSRGYTRMIADLQNNVMGSGLAVAGDYQSYQGEGARRVIDGAVIEIFLALGVFGGCIYSAGIAAVVVAVLIRRTDGESELVRASRAILLAMTLALASGTTTVGENGLLFWLAAGLSLAAKPIAREAYDPISPQVALTVGA
ncbi:hypothetical protein BH10PSE12_BH10PSE12_29820 [soil metagenome]